MFQPVDCEKTSSQLILEYCIFLLKSKTTNMKVVDKNYQQAIHTIFIADDDEEDLQILSQALREIKPNLTIETFTKTDDLFSMLNHLMPDVIFLDLVMPCKNGLVCIKELRENEQTRNIPIIVFSSTSRPTNIEVAYEMGANLFLIKPAFYQSLVATLEMLLAFDWSDPEAVKKTRFVNDKYIPFP